MERYGFLAPRKSNPVVVPDQVVRFDGLFSEMHVDFAVLLHHPRTTSGVPRGQRFPRRSWRIWPWTSDDLRDESCPCPCILVILVMPTDETQWLGQTSEEMLLRHCAYWLSLRGFRATTNTHNVRVTILLTKVLSVASVTALLQQVAERRVP